MEDAKIEFLPFHAINEFMRVDFRISVVRTALNTSPSLPVTLRDSLNHLTKRLVKVPGFRNPEKAPATIRLLPSIAVFEKNPEFVAAILAAWVEAKSDLRSQVFQMLKMRGWYTFPTEFKSLADFPLPKTESEWGILPVEADRTRLPGFVIYWPKKENFESIYNSYTEMFPDGEASIDEVSLMAVWLSMRLPYQHTENKKPDEGASEPENKL